MLPFQKAPRGFFLQKLGSQIKQDYIGHRGQEIHDREG